VGKSRLGSRKGCSGTGIELMVRSSWPDFGRVRHPVSGTLVPRLAGPVTGRSGRFLSRCG
jgi:hypothetical protein